DIKSILDTLCRMSASLNMVTTAVAEIKESNTDFRYRMNEQEQHIAALEDRVANGEKKIDSMEMKITVLSQRLDDQKNRARRNNLCFLGFPEMAGQGKSIKFIQETLPALLQLAEGTQLEVEQRPAAGQRPRPIIVRFLWFPIKEMILCKARELGPLEWEGNKILIFPDLSERRKKFNEVKRRLRDHRIKYGLFYPAMLKITVDGKDT
uniref:L1 transposable element RRM domain-containing protein n=1 Tax=Latimeria chalumnae TaxID=7897 RepID=H3B3N5_LATCH